MKRILFLSALGFTLQAYAADDSTKKAELDREVSIFMAEKRRLERDIDIAQRAVDEAQGALYRHQYTANPAVLAAVKKLRLEAIERKAAEERAEIFEVMKTINRQ